MANSAAARVAAKPAFPPKEREGGREGREGEREYMSMYGKERQFQ